MKEYNISTKAIGGFLAQVDSPLALDAWFESSEERRYVIKFSDYCNYLTIYDRDGYSNPIFSQSSGIMKKITTGTLDMKLYDAEKTITESYCCFIRDIGLMLLKEAGLYVRKDSDWTHFDIAVSIPIVLKEAFGCTQVPAVVSSQDYKGFVEVPLDKDFDAAVKSMELLNEIVNRSDISLQDLIMTKDTPLEPLVLKGVQYLTLSKMMIKGRVIQDE